MRVEKERAEKSEDGRVARFANYYELGRLSGVHWAACQILVTAQAYGYFKYSEFASGNMLAVSESGKQGLGRLQMTLGNWAMPDVEA